jgi:hypothetical protein
MTDDLKKVVGQVLEGWTLPEGVRKMLETAYFASEETTKSQSFEDWFASWKNPYGTPETVEADKYAARAGWDAASGEIVYQVGTRITEGILWCDVDHETYEKRAAEPRTLVRVSNVTSTKP